MKKIDKQAMDRKAELVRKLRQAEEAIQDAVNVYDEKLAEIYKPVEAAVQAYNDLVSEVVVFVGNVTASMNDYFNDRLERWQESNTGLAFDHWREEWDNLDISPVVSEEPEGFVSFDLELADELENLPDEPS